MTAQEVEAFLAVVRHGTISQAAAALYITQPALSRRIRTLEKELGCTLLERQKGIRTVRMTEEGQEFLALAERWQYLWAQTGALSSLHSRQLLHVAAVESVSLHILPWVFQAFLQSGQYDLNVHQCHSVDAYSYMESGPGDIAFITDPMFSATVTSIPAFSEPFVLASRKPLEGRVIHPSTLPPEDEVRFSWNNEYDTWHTKWFDARTRPSVMLDQVSLMDCFLKQPNWAIVPHSIGVQLAEQGVYVYPLQDGPTDRMIYYLAARDGKQELIATFLSLLDQELQKYDCIRSFISK